MFGQLIFQLIWILRNGNIVSTLLVRAQNECRATHKTLQHILPRNECRCFKGRCRGGGRYGAKYRCTVSPFWLANKNLFIFNSKGIGFPSTRSAVLAISGPVDFVRFTFVILLRSHYGRRHCWNRARFGHLRSHSEMLEF